MKQKQEFKEWYVKEMKKGSEGVVVPILKKEVPMRTAYILYWSLYLVALFVAFGGLSMTSNLFLFTFLGIACILLGFAFWIKHQMKQTFLSFKDEKDWEHFIDHRAD